MNKALTVLFLILVFAILTVGGIYAGSFVFCVIQKVPRELVSLSLLFDYHAEYGNIPEVKKTLKAAAFIAALIPIAGTGLLAYALFAPNAQSLFGEADFAKPYELRKAGLLNPDPSNTEYPSLLIGKIGDKFLTFATQTFAILKAATRRGKGVGFVIPNLLWYRDSMIVNDPKKENWKLTAGFRAKCGQECFLFSPDSGDYRSHKWNALSYIRRDINRVADIQNIAEMLYPVLPNVDPFWAEQPQILFTGFALYMLDTPGEECTLPRLLALTTPDDGLPLHKWIVKTINDRSEGDNPLKRETVSALMTWAGNASENTRSSILSAMQSPLSICRDPVAALALSGDDFDLREVRKKRMTVYIGLEPRNMQRFSRIINLFFSQLINENTHELPEDDPALKYQCGLMLDEFAMLGFVGKIKDGVSYLAGYNIRPLLIFQNKAQIEEIYGEKGAKILTSNCGLEIVYAPKENDDAQEYSESLGYKTVAGKSKSRSSGKTSSSSESTSDQKRALMLPQEIKALGFEKEIIIAEDVKPAVVDKIIYWKDPFFKGKIGLPVPVVPKLDIERAMNISANLKIVSVEEIRKNDIKDFHNEADLTKLVEDVMQMSIDDIKSLI